MLPAQEQVYPRPDFERSDLVWCSLNGTWNFMFDDEDKGLTQRWHLTGLPARAAQGKEQFLEREDEYMHRREIQVPFVFQTSASGINDRGAHEVLWYERSIEDVRSEEHIKRKHRLLLRFGAIDYQATIWLNGQFVDKHQGGHVPFDVDITDAVENTSRQVSHRLTIRVHDSPYDLSQPRGKQYWGPEPENIFYTPSSGIWQSVWLESVPSVRIADSSHGTVLQSYDVESGVLHVKLAVIGRRAQEPLTIQIESSFEGLPVSRESLDLSREDSFVALDLSMLLTKDQIEGHAKNHAPLAESTVWHANEDHYLALWSPEHPLLYDIKIQLLNSSGVVLDVINTSTGMRSLSWKQEDRTFHLNGKPYFQALVLDQGYWPQSGLTPPFPDALKTDIELSKAMGFNGCRKHQKVEDPLFLYWADRLGYLVWGEMANAYRFSTSYVEMFDKEWKEAMLRDINHPCIVTWTPINESWGYDDLAGNKTQRNHLRSLYFTTKTIDPARPINDNCGWEHVCTDLTTFHEYADAPALADICRGLHKILEPKGGRPMMLPEIEDDIGSKVTHDRALVLCTEFGGVNIAPSKDQKAGDKDWGYTTASDPEDLLKRFEALVMAVVEGGYCCGFVYTQLTDIEQEVNGLYTFDRTAKLDTTKVKAIMDKARSRYFDILQEWKDGVRTDDVHEQQ